MLSSGHWEPDEDGEFFIDRDAKHFITILNYLRYDEACLQWAYLWIGRSGKMDLKGWKKLDLEKLQEDLDYYQIQLPEPTTTTLPFQIKRNNGKPQIRISDSVETMRAAFIYADEQNTSEDKEISSELSFKFLKW